MTGRGKFFDACVSFPYLVLVHYSIFLYFIRGSFFLSGLVVFFPFQRILAPWLNCHDHHTCRNNSNSSLVGEERIFLLSNCENWHGRARSPTTKKKHFLCSTYRCWTSPFPSWEHRKCSLLNRICLFGDAWFPLRSSSPKMFLSPKYLPFSTGKQRWGSSSS